MKTLILIFGLASMGLLSACSTTSGVAPDVTTSGFDGARVVNIVPHGNVSDWKSIPTGLGAQWHSNDPDNVFLLVRVYTFTAITGAELNIDGEKIVLQPIGNATGLDVPVPNVQESTNEFITKLSTVEKILKSKRTWLRVYTPTGTLESAVIDGQTDSKAFHALERFMVAVKAP